MAMKRRKTIVKLRYAAPISSAFCYIDLSIAEATLLLCVHCYVQDSRNQEARHKSRSFKIQVSL
jgi:hypothetical protein